ncbi:MAG: tripartite tricarboxylate transporter TctB family protein [Burkholderiales bacterium]|nr:tripartite tricarboxylate transporter TctB family protein [Burkholderiales bacterium]
MKITSQEDFWAGIMFIAFGALAIFIASDYPYGTAARMGPGYFPTWIGIVMVILGLMITVSGFRVQGQGIGKWPWKAMILISLAFIFFGWAIDNVGFIIALFVMVTLAAMAGRDYRWLEAGIVAIVLIIGSWALFIKALELSFPLWWWR